jgi:hypothetical protein
VNPISLLLRLPLLPLQGVIWLGETLRDQAEHELYDPLAVRRELEEAADAAASGDLSPDELARKQDEVVGRMVHRPAGGPGPAPGDQHRRRPS